MSNPSAGERHAPLAIALAGSAVLATAMGVGRFLYTPTLPAMAADLGLDPAESGLIASANFAGYFIGCLVLIWLGASRRGALLAGGLAASVATSAAMAAADGIAMFMLLRFVSGLASALCMVAGGGIVLDALRAAGRPTLGGLHWAGVGLGILVSGLAVALLPHLGWRDHWLIGAAMSLGLSAFAVATLRGHDGASAATGGAIARPLALGVLLLAHTLEGLGYSVYGTFVVQLFRDTPGLAALAQFAWVIVGVGAIPSAIVGAWASTRYGALPSFAAGFFIQAFAIALPILVPGTASAVVSALLFGGTLMSITLHAVDAARMLAGARGLAIVSLGFAFGQMVGPWGAGLMALSAGGFAAPTLASAGVAIVGGCLAAALAMALRRR